MKYSIDQIREMLGKISSWPWRANGGDGVYDKHGESIILNTDYNTSGVYERYGCQIKPPPNHTLIVNAPTIISYLLDQLEEARKCIEWYSDDKHWLQEYAIEINGGELATKAQLYGPKLARQALDRMK